MNALRNLSVGAKLWLAVAFIVVALPGTVAMAGIRSARLTAASEKTLSELSLKTAIATEWAGLTETNVTRVQASTLSSDPAIAELYKDAIPLGVARITELQEQLGRMPLNATIAFARRTADGDLTARIDTGRQDEFGAMLVALGHMRDRLLGVVAEVKHGTENINVAAREIATGNHDLSARTEQTASSLQETAASME